MVLYYNFYFLGDSSIFIFVSREFVVACWSILWWLRWNLSQIITISGLLPLCCHQLIVFSQAAISLVFDAVNDFLLHPGQFGHYVRRLLSLFKSSLLAVTFGLACRFWSIFVGCNSNDCFVFLALPMLFWSIVLVLLGWLDCCFPAGAAGGGWKCFSGPSGLLDGRTLNI